MMFYGKITFSLFGSTCAQFFIPILTVSTWWVSKATMRMAMLKAHELGMTNGEYAFVYFDLYNTNTSYSWTDDDDMPWDSTGNKTLEEGKLNRLMK